MEGKKTGKGESEFMTSYLHQVHYYETDRMGITHHSNYIRWMEEARVAFLEELGFGYDRLEKLGIQSPVTQVACEYKRPTTFPDRVAVSVKVEEYTGVRLTLAYEMKNAETGELAALGSSGHCFLDGFGRPVRLKKELPEFDCLLKRIAGQTWSGR